MCPAVALGASSNIRLFKTSTNVRVRLPGARLGPRFHLFKLGLRSHLLLFPQTALSPQLCDSIPFLSRRSASALFRANMKRSLIHSSHDARADDQTRSDPDVKFTIAEKGAFMGDKGGKKDKEKNKQQQL